MKKQLPPPTPPYTGGEPNARKHRDATAPRLLPLPKGRAMATQIHRDAILPLCKGELEGVVAAPAPCGRNLKSRNHKS
ncbi:hypothetical protein D8S85_07190 [Butyricimonas faecalis]|uniref:Uncharacterized protein n=1 Tax=Butyricimonas faecalis TaxID=2093856 RepID=A0A3Q9IMI2_9BACT|nr:hypothetical protein D8S85_07190 [Butyricimonas faecalis]